MKSIRLTKKTGESAQPSIWKRVATFAVVAGSVVTTAQAAVIFDYRFESGPAGAPVQTVLDSGPNGLHGSTAGANPTTFTAYVAPTGGNFSMNASGDLNYARVTNSNLMHVQEFSLSALVNPTGRGGFFPPNPFTNCWDDTMCSIVSKKWGEGGNFLDSYGIYYLQNSGQFRGYVGFGNEAGRVLTSSNSFPIGSGWHDVVLTLDRDVSGPVDRLSLYVDDVLQASLDEALPDLFFNTGDLQIGASNFFANPEGDFRRNFDGLIDSVKLTDLPFAPSAVPVPPTIALLLAGFAGVAATRRRRDPKGMVAQTVGS
jgi:hypothetical protein